MSGLSDFRDRVAVVTGASSGIGAGLARALARRGARVALVARRADRLEELAREIERAGSRALPLACDVADEASVQAAARRVIDELGRIDLMVNAAGHNRHVLFKDHPTAEIEQMMRVNYLGTVHWIRATLPALRSQGRGWIVNVSSLAGKLGQPDEAAYSASKFAVTGLSEALSYEFEPLGIHVMCVYPALVRTEMFDEATMARMPARSKGSFIEVDEFCEAVLAALGRGAYEVTVPRPFAFVYLMRLLFPRMMRKQTAKIRLPILPDLTR